MTASDPQLVMHSESISGTGADRLLHWVDVHRVGTEDRITHGTRPVEPVPDPEGNDSDCERIKEETTWCTPGGNLMKMTCITLICDGEVVSRDCTTTSEGTC